MGDNLPTAEMTSVSEKERASERRKRLQKSGAAAAALKMGREKEREMWPFVRHFVKREREEGKKEEKEKRPYLGILRRRRRPSAQIRSGGPCGTASAASADPSHRYRDVTADKITSLGGGVG